MCRFASRAILLLAILMPTVASAEFSPLGAVIIYAASSAPKIDKIQPRSATWGDIITIDGANLQNAVVYFSGAEYASFSKSQTQIRLALVRYPYAVPTVIDVLVVTPTGNARDTFTYQPT